ncbi:protein phosphatase 2C domain-containing protein [Salinibacterium sp. UTAS2018]|uniref:PP2C family serine/threonine-protein phosphatase n=1 Tax=Salinibacterium sp. UTAS2018 TaxID=2508880 RepID=UPI0010093D1A|nr:PP2C family serine/threonine-protein phosphatase [Salinibacterium sp. UTAS2018]QAV69203.1 protein phosphatase 2C domain-containing protein [Salinibacterium sp. UTAS2018]
MFNEFHHQARGRGHALDGTRGQDRTQYLSRGGVQAICLADGAGSASHSEFGAQAVVDEGCVALVEQFDRLVASTDGGQVKIELLARLLAKVTTVAERHGHDVHDFASTFLGVAVSGDQFLGAHVGDGVIGYLKDGELHVISAPDNSEFANQTTFVTSSGAAVSMRLFRGSLQGVTGFILMSDGAGESLFNARTRQLADACTKIIVAVGNTPARLSKNSKPKKQLRKLVDVRVRNATKDDCAIGVLGRPELV